MLPENIEMRAAERTWVVHYMACKKKLELFERPDHELVFLGDMSNQSSCKKKLATWVRGQANIHLRHLLTTVSEQFQLPYKNLTIRDQRTRWGSCSAMKNINLNYKLIFLPLSLARHVLIHELCHTVHLNHSDQFWRLVHLLDSNTYEHKRALRHAGQYLPSWLTV